MLLEALEVNNFRNLSGKVSWGAGLNIIYGDNGEGKTNWIEAIYLLATTKSFRTPRLQETIKFDEEATFVRGTVAQSEDVHRDLQISLQKNTKSISVNGKREPIARYLGQLHAIAFTADDLTVVRGQSDSRRRFIDRGVVALHPPYVQTLADYNKVIRQKNRLLQDSAESGLALEKLAEMLAPWHDQLVELGAALHRARSDYVDRLNGALQHRLFGREDVTIRYVSALEDKGDLKDYEGLFAERLRLRIQAELAAGYSLIGPHRDDLEIRFDGRDIRVFGSSGQQRSALIILDLAALSVYHSWHNEYPLFLVDDIDAELDLRRIGSLLEYLEGRTQTFVTTSKEHLVDEFISRANLYRINSGMIANATADRRGPETFENAIETV